MNRQLEGWRLAAAVLVPLLIVIAAVWFLVQALSSDSGEQTVGTAAIPAPTSVPTTAPVLEAAAAPTPAPTPLTLQAVPAVAASPTPAATVAPEPAPTAVPAPTTAPAPTTVSEPAPTSVPAATPTPGGPTPSPTTDPSALSVTCSGAAFPITVAPGDVLPELQALVTPADAAGGLSFKWNFQDNTFVGAPNTGTVTYDTEGTYTVTLEALDATGQQVALITCGSVTVAATAGGGSEPIDGPVQVSCRVRPVDSNVKWEDATVGNKMRVSVDWTPATAVLDLQYEFSLEVPIVFSVGAEPGDSRDFQFSAPDASARIFWRSPETGETGRVSCPAFKTVVATSTPVPTTGATATPTATST